MVKANQTYDVFISHSHQDTQSGQEIARILRSYDLQVFTNAEIPVGAKLEDAIWDAMAESHAMVAIISEGEPSAWLVFEIGAARAWNKPVYGIVSNPSSTRLPAALHDLRVYPASRIDEVAQEIKRSSESLSDSEIESLVDAYRRTDVSVDQLALQPQRLSELTKQFQKQTGRQAPGEQLLRILLRLRKQRALPPISKSNTHQAS